MGEKVSQGSINLQPSRACLAGLDSCKSTLMTDDISRSAKLATSVATQFTAEYCMQWKTYFPDQELGRPFPTFDGRCVAYPKRKILR
jgi:tRNA(His) 5'-end guanylyltransferase